jgi:transcriptional regulator with XRE-family HTH domain
MKQRKNLVGRTVARLRYERDWTQEELSRRLTHAGWPISRSEVSKIEAGGIYVCDFQLYYFAEVFGVSTTALLPEMVAGQPVQDTVLRVIHQRYPETDDIPPQFEQCFFSS